MNPDEFFVLVDDSDPTLVRSVTLKQKDYWVGKDGEADLPQALERAGCPEFAKRVREHLQILSGICLG